MKLAVIFILWSIVAFAQEMPKLFFPIGTPRNDIIYDWGKPMYMSKDQIHYELRYQNTLEGIDFFIDDNENLEFYVVDIIVQPSPIIKFSKLFEKVYTDYTKKYILLFGEPTAIDKKTGYYVWKYKDSSVVFWPYKHEVFWRMKLLCAPNDKIAEVLGK